MSKLQMVVYSPADFDKLWKRTSALPEDYPLRCRSFVDYYYASSDYCQLYLALDGEGEVAGFQGVEWMPFCEDDKNYIFGFGSNFYAFKPGTGAYLLMNWLKNCNAGLVFGGSDDMNRFISKAGWSYFQGVGIYMMNRRFKPCAENGWLKMTAKKFLKRAPFRKALCRLADGLPSSAVSVSETRGFSDGMLDFKSAFRFRFCPDQKYLTWRYGPDVPFLRYRTFAITKGGVPAGYVVLLDNPEEVVVVHADGISVETLADGIVKSIAGMAAGPSDKREAVVVSTHAAMGELFESVGFRTREVWNRPFALGRMKGGFKIEAPVSDWMVSLGWGDNAVRPPFLEPGTKALPE